MTGSFEELNECRTSEYELLSKLDRNFLGNKLR